MRTGQRRVSWKKQRWGMEVEVSFFFSTPFISRNSPLSEHLDHTNSWSKVRRESPAYLIFCFNLFPVFLTPSFLLSLTVKTKNPIMESKLYETTSDDNQRNLYVIQ